MRHPEGTIIQHGNNAYRARFKLRGQEHSRTLSTSGDAKQRFLGLRLSSDDDEVAQNRLSREARRWEISRCNVLINDQAHLSGTRAMDVVAAGQRLMERKAERIAPMPNRKASSSAC